MIKDSKGFCGVAGGLFVLLAITPWAAKIDGKQPSPPLHGAFAQDLTIADSKVLLDVAVRGAAVAFSWDGKKLAYAHRPKPIGAPGPNSSAHKLVVVSLPQGGLLQEFSFDREISGVAWSPNNTQILVLGQFRSGRNCTIVDLTSGRLLPIGNHVITGNEPYWSEPEQVYFFERQEPADGPPLAGTIQGFHTLSLESLRASWEGDAQRAKAKAAELRQALSVRAPQAFKLLRDGGMTASLSAANLDGTYVRILANHGHGNEGIRNIWSAPDAQFAVTESGNGRLHLFKIGTRARPNLKISASWLQVTDPTSGEIQSVKDWLAQGREVRADVSVGRINPLNQRVIGAQGQTIGEARISAVSESGVIEALYVREESGLPKAGLVLHRFRAAGYDYAGLLAGITRVH